MISEAMISQAMDAVLRRAVVANDHKLVEAHQHIYLQHHPKQTSSHTALRLGLLLGLELRRQEGGK